MVIDIDLMRYMVMNLKNVNKIVRSLEGFQTVDTIAPNVASDVLSMQIQIMEELVLEHD